VASVCFDPQAIEGWGAGPAKMDEKVGTEFSLWDGEVWGKNIKVIPTSKFEFDILRK